MTAGVHAKQHSPQARSRIRPLDRRRVAVVPNRNSARPVLDGDRRFALAVLLKVRQQADEFHHVQSAAAQIEAI